MVPVWVPTGENLADLLTKILPLQAFNKLRDQIMQRYLNIDGEGAKTKVKSAHSAPAHSAGLQVTNNVGSID